MVRGEEAAVGDCGIARGDGLRQARGRKSTEGCRGVVSGQERSSLDVEDVMWIGIWVWIWREGGGEKHRRGQLVIREAAAEGSQRLRGVLRVGRASEAGKGHTSSVAKMVLEVIRRDRSVAMPRSGQTQAPRPGTIEWASRMKTADVPAQ